MEGGSGLLSYRLLSGARRVTLEAEEEGLGFGLDPVPQHEEIGVPVQPEIQVEDPMGAGDGSPLRATHSPVPREAEEDAFHTCSNTPAGRFPKPSREAAMGFNYQASVSSSDDSEDEGYGTRIPTPHGGSMVAPETQTCMAVHAFLEIEEATQITGGVPEAIEPFFLKAHHWVLMTKDGKWVGLRFMEFFRLHLKDSSEALRIFDECQEEVRQGATPLDSDGNPCGLSTLDPEEARQTAITACADLKKRFEMAFNSNQGVWLRRVEEFTVINPTTKKIYATPTELLQQFYQACKKAGGQRGRWNDDEIWEKVKELLNDFSPPAILSSNPSQCERPLGAQLQEMADREDTPMNGANSELCYNHTWVMQHANAKWMRLVTLLTKKEPTAAYSVPPGVGAGKRKPTGQRAGGSAVMTVQTQCMGDTGKGREVCGCCGQAHSIFDCWTRYPWKASLTFMGPPEEHLYRIYQARWKEEYGFDMVPYTASVNEKRERLQTFLRRLSPGLGPGRQGRGRSGGRFGRNSARRTELQGAMLQTVQRQQEKPQQIAMVRTGEEATQKGAPTHSQEPKPDELYDFHDPFACLVVCAVGEQPAPKGTPKEEGLLRTFIEHTAVVGMHGFKPAAPPQLQTFVMDEEKINELRTQQALQQPRTRPSLNEKAGKAPPRPTVRSQAPKRQVTLLELQALTDQQALDMLRLEEKLLNEVEELREKVKKLQEQRAGADGMVEAETQNPVMSIGRASVTIDPATDGGVWYLQQDHPTRGMIIECPNLPDGDKRWALPAVVFLDNGSDPNLISSSLVKRLQLPTVSCRVPTRGFSPESTVMVTEKLAVLRVVFNRGMEDEMPVDIKDVFVVQDDPMYQLLLGNSVVNCVKLDARVCPRDQNLQMIGTCTVRPVCRKHHLSQGAQTIMTSIYAPEASTPRVMAITVNLHEDEVEGEPPPLLTNQELAREDYTRNRQAEIDAGMTPAHPHFRWFTGLEGHDPPRERQAPPPVSRHNPLPHQLLGWQFVEGRWVTSGGTGYNAQHNERVQEPQGAQHAERVQEPHDALQNEGSKSPERERRGRVSSQDLLRAQGKRYGPMGTQVQRS